MPTGWEFEVAEEVVRRHSPLRILQALVVEKQGGKDFRVMSSERLGPGSDSQLESQPADTLVFPGSGGSGSRGSCVVGSAIGFAEWSGERVVIGEFRYDSRCFR